MNQASRRLCKLDSIQENIPCQLQDLSHPRKRIDPHGQAACH